MKTKYYTRTMKAKFRVSFDKPTGHYYVLQWHVDHWLQIGSEVTSEEAVNFINEISR